MSCCILSSSCPDMMTLVRDTLRRNEDGSTALHLAAYFGHSVVRFSPHKHGMLMTRLCRSFWVFVRSWRSWWPPLTLMLDQGILHEISGKPQFSTLEYGQPEMCLHAGPNHTIIDDNHRQNICVRRESIIDTGTRCIVTGIRNIITGTRYIKKGIYFHPTGLCLWLCYACACEYVMDAMWQ